MSMSQYATPQMVLQNHSIANNVSRQQHPSIRPQSINSSSNNNNNNMYTSTNKICSHCKKPIYPGIQEGKGTLKALGRFYHEKCFTCHDCDLPLKPKFFPFQEDPNSGTILLCQYHYFKRHDLLCRVCDKPLRGLYYTAFGGRYDEEHFSCTLCHAPCGVKKCFMFNDKLYCKYHFLKFFSKRCKGCTYPISDQYIEFPKGNEIHCWHPECYGIHKYWHVNLSPDTLGLPFFPLTKYNPSLPLQDISPTGSELDKQMQAFNFILTKTWTILYKFEEETASCISDMFQYLSSSDQSKGLQSTALFILKIECLFRGLDYFIPFNNCLIPSKLEHQSSNMNAQHSAIQGKYRSLTRNLSTKIMIYLQLLRKLGSNPPSNDLVVSSFMSVITGLAHFLKLIIRYGFYTTLETNKISHSVTPLTKFLSELEKGQQIKNDPFTYISVPVAATDNCSHCQKYIQEECIQFREFRWHLHCFTCSLCGDLIKPRDINDATFVASTSSVYCCNCSLENPNSVPGFNLVSRLSQLIYLLKIALIRSKTVMKAHSLTSQGLSTSNGSRESFVIQQSYIRTLNDIKRLRSRRESVRVTNNKVEARKSIILNTAEEDINNSANKDSTGLIIETEKLLPKTAKDRSHPENVFNNTKTLTLDDISRIVAAEQARELRPNAFTHFKKLREKEDDTLAITQRRSGIYYSELKDEELQTLWIISASLLLEEGKIAEDDINKLIPKISAKNKGDEQPNFWNQMKTAMGMKSKKAVARKVFGSPLDIVSEKWGVDSDLGVGPKKIKIPIVMDELISSLHQMDMSVEGIFRKNGNIRRLKELSQMIDDNPMEMPDLSKENAIQLSALLKKFIRDLPDPILTVSLYKLWIEAAKIESDFESERIICLIYSLLPVYNRNMLEVLLSFLYWAASFSHIENEMGSKMDIHNLSTVIAPNILYLPERTDTDLTHTESYTSGFAENEGQHHFLAIEIADFLINRNEEMAIVPKFLYLLMKDVTSQGIEYDYEKVRKYIAQRNKEHSIDFTEFNRQNSMKVKTSSTRVFKTLTNKQDNSTLQAETSLGYSTTL